MILESELELSEDVDEGLDDQQWDVGGLSLAV